jgi:hypothetical protein
MLFYSNPLFLFSGLCGHLRLSASTFLKGNPLVRFISVINVGTVSTLSAPVCRVSHITCKVSYPARDMPSVCGEEKAP